MVLHELRIHYGAPSLVRDDAKWRTLANNIANFRASHTLKITSRKATETTETTETTVASNKEFNEAQPSSVEPETKRRAGGRIIHGQLDIEEKVPDGLPHSHRVARKRKYEDGVDNSYKFTENKRTCFSRSKIGLDPVLKNPATAHHLVEKQVERTPYPTGKDILSKSTVLVPFTGSPEQRRARLKTVTNRQCMTDTNYSDLLSSSRVETTSFDLLDSSATEILDCELPSVGIEDESLTFQTQIIQDEIPLGLAQTPLHDRTPFTELIGSDFEKCEGSEGLDQNSSVITQSLSVSTESLTQAYELNTESSPLGHRSIPSQASFVNLTEESVPRELTRQDVLGSVTSPAVNMNAPPPPFEIVCTKTIKRKLLALPKRIYCSAPVNKYERFQSFVPESLRALANKFDLAQKFRPVEAVERIKNGDRGYWKMLIRITKLVVVTKSRRSPLSSSQWSDEKFLLAQGDHKSMSSPIQSRKIEDVMRRRHYPDKCPSTFTPWTLDEFVDFWTLLRKTIGKGRAGYDVHATIADNLTECDEGVDMEIRLYGYAEALTHMWYILYVLSNKKAAYMPMQWMGTGQGMRIKMSGQPRGCDSTGRWTELSPGIQGSWGFVAFSKELDRVGKP